MPSFLSDFRRFSFHKSPNRASSNGSSDGSGEPSNKSSSTIATAPGSTTPPSLVPSDRSATQANGATSSLPRRPPIQTSGSARYSMLNGSGLTLNSSSSPRPQQQPSSMYAPRILSVSDNSWVHQKLLLVYGQIADPALQAFDGTLWVCHHQDKFPATSWPVCDSHFKALVHLEPGPNRLRFDFVSPKISTPSNSPAHSSWMNINYLPLVSTPPLDLVILTGCDSPMTFDAVPERIQREGNNLDTAIRKYKMAAYLWAAFTGEQMNRHSFGRRCFRFEEEWQSGTLSYRDWDTSVMRNEAKVHVIKSTKTVAELRDLERAQQNPTGTQKDELYGIAMEAVRGYFSPQPGQTRYVSCLLLDSHWDADTGVIRGHAALGGGDGSVQLAIFGSHALQSYPSCIEEVAPAFSDCTRTDTSILANDNGECGSNWEAANVGIGAHLHEVGHLLGCPHQTSGVMLRDYVRLNRTFVCREAYSTRTKSPGQRLCLQQDECGWHRLDCLRFRFHPCFRLPSDIVNSAEDSIQVYGVDNSTGLVTSSTGVAWAEIYPECSDCSPAHIEFIDGSINGGTPQKQVMLSESDLRSRLPADKQKKKLRLEVFSTGGSKQVIPDFGELVSKGSRMKLANGQMAFRGSSLGSSRMEGTRAQEIILSSAQDQKKLLTQVIVYHGMAVDGIEFVYEDTTTQLFGNRKDGGGSEFSLDTRRGEVLVGFYVRAGFWIDGVQVLTSNGRKSEVYGKAAGGEGYTLVAPRGYSMAGISGTCAAWLDGISLIITR